MRIIGVVEDACLFFIVLGLILVDVLLVMNPPSKINHVKDEVEFEPQNLNLQVRSIQARSVMLTHLTLVTVPNSFTNDINNFQQTAIHSWMQLQPAPDIEVVGRDKTLKEFAKENDLIHISPPGKGIMYLNELLDEVMKKTDSKYIALVASNITLHSAITAAAQYVSREVSDNFLMVASPLASLDTSDDLHDRVYDYDLDNLDDSYPPQVFLFPRYLFDLVSVPAIPVAPDCMAAIGLWMMYVATAEDIDIIDGTHAFYPFWLQSDQEKAVYSETPLCHSIEWMEEILDASLATPEDDDDSDDMEAEETPDTWLDPVDGNMERQLHKLWTTGIQSQLVLEQQDVLTFSHASA